VVESDALMALSEWHNLTLFKSCH